MVRQVGACVHYCAVYAIHKVSTTFRELCMTNRQGETRVAAATIIGTAIEWYDFFLYAAAAGLVFNKVFFASNAPILSYSGSVVPVSAARRLSSWALR